MKFFAAVTLLVAAGVTAQDSNCEAEYIVSRCLKTENDKATSCAATDMACLCAAYQAIATCYNNCPNDTRAAPAHNQVIAYCRNVTTTSTSTMATSTAGTSGSGSGSSSNAASSSIATNLNAPAPTSTGFQATSGTSTGGAFPTAVNQAGSAAVAAGLAGALMAML